MWLLFFTALAAEPWPQRSCDMPSVDLARSIAPSAEQCEARCRERDDCGGYSFVSGLSRCALEVAGARAFEIQMFAAKITQSDGQRSVTAPTPDHDHAGQDLELVPRDLPSTSACAEACLGTLSCVGFVYIRGYRACWLKATDGALTPKSFVCAHRVPAPDSRATTP